jgi:GNAT superfamily N-acetyltransferase
MRIREATWADAAAMERLINAAFSVEKGHFKQIERITQAELREHFADGTFLLAEEEGALLASVYVQGCTEQGEAGYLGMLSVLPALQGQGMSRRMTHEAEQWCAAHGCCAIELDTVDLRPELRIIYGKMGYAVFSTRPAPCPERFTQPVQFIRMRKLLVHEPGAGFTLDQ